MTFFAGGLLLEIFENTVRETESAAALFQCTPSDIGESEQNATRERNIRTKYMV